MRSIEDYLKHIYQQLFHKIEKQGREVPPRPMPAAFSSDIFVYDCDGRRVKSTINPSTPSAGQATTTTYFVGAHYEVTGSTITKYYYAGSQRIAMRTDGTLNYLLGDHLGSTSLTTDASGQMISQVRYKAWGETLYSSGTTPTKYTYTGQYSNMSDFGLMFYNARWYDPVVGRFAQADTIVPGVENSQAWDRFAYASNNPLTNVDPSGHDDTPWWEIIKFIAGRLIENSRMTVSEWEAAADTFIPAEQKGSNFTTFVSAGIAGGGMVMESNMVTTADGQYQQFLTQGGGIVSPGVSASAGWAQGAIEGNFETPADFEGYAIQAAGGGTLPVLPVGIGGDVWAGLVETADGKLGYSGVYGYDGAVNYGIPGLNGSVVFSNAVPANDLVHNNLVNSGLLNTSVGQAYDRYVDRVTHFDLDGFGLFACRAVHQCGRSVEK